MLVKRDCSVDWYDSPTAHNSKVRTVRRSWRCIECNEEIQPGEQYEDAHELYDGSWLKFKTYLICVGLREDFCPTGFVYGGLKETMQECLGLSPDTEKDGD